jgi:hypothetical protein
VLTYVGIVEPGTQTPDFPMGPLELLEAGTEHHLGLIQGWFQDCDNNHVCRPSKSKQCSTLLIRLIDVGIDGDDSVRLHEVRPDDTGDWIALSYQ